jgi:hypothetical protein
MPEREHRIELSPDTKDILIEARNCVDTLILEHPEVIGVTIFGSNIKGNARSIESDPKDPSDLDGTLFIDTDKLGIPWNHRFRENGLVNNDLPTEIYNYYESLINTTLEGTFPSFEIKPEMISHEILKEMVRVLLESGPHTGGNDISFQRSETLSKLFRFSFGTASLAEYRLFVLDEITRQTDLKNKALKEDPDNWLVSWRYDPDEYWKSIVDNLYFWEFKDKDVIWGSLDRNEKQARTYPQTIQDAKKYWSLSGK